jgi:hypothetical protein
MTRAALALLLFLSGSCALIRATAADVLGGQEAAAALGADAAAAAGSASSAAAAAAGGGSTSGGGDDNFLASLSASALAEWQSALLRDQDLKYVPAAKQLIYACSGLHQHGVVGVGGVGVGGR